MLSSNSKLELVRSSVAVLTFSLLLSGCLESNEGTSSESDSEGLAGELLPTSGAVAGIVPGVQVSTEGDSATAAEEAFLGDNILIMNKASGRALDAAENINGGNVQIFADSGFSNQRWSIAKVGDVFSIRSMQDDTRALDTWDAGSIDGTNIALYGYYGSDSQHYQIEEAGSGWYIVRPVIASDQCLDAFGLGDKGNVGTWTCHSEDNQLWTFKKVSAGTEAPPVAPEVVASPGDIEPYPKGRLGVEGRITYNLELDGVEPNLAAYIANSMKNAVKLYNDNGVFTKHITASYNVGVPTAQGGYSGQVTFGSQRNTRVALHEIAHTLGVGTHPNWFSMQTAGMWTGAAANAKYSEFQGTDSRVEVNSGHILNTYGLNYDWQESGENNIRHIQLVSALRCDMGIGPCSDFEGEDIVIVNRASGKVLDAAGGDNGSNVIIYTDYQNPNQRWSITSVGSGNYKIGSMQEGEKALDVWDSGTVNGTNIALWDYFPGDNRHFIIEEVDTGWFTIKPSNANGQCLDAYGTESGKNVGTWECHGRENQQWGFNRSVVVAEVDDTDADSADDTDESEESPEPQIEPREYRDPPYYGSIFINTVNDIVTSADPTAFVRITYKGIEERRTYDRRPDRWQEAWFYLYEAEYENGRRIEMQVNYEFSRSEADEEARYYAIEVGRMPNVLRRDLDSVTIHDGVELWGGGSRNLLIHTGQSRLYAADGIIEETLIHEATHASLDDRYETTDGWIRAQQIDNMFITNYARDYSTREDVAESYLLYLAIRHKPERISSSLERTIEDTMPARIRYFDSLGLDVYPFE